jgi:hypothetical protein
LESLQCLSFIPDGIFTTTNAGNIAVASTDVVSQVMMVCYDAYDREILPVDYMTGSPMSKRTMTKTIPIAAGFTATHAQEGILCSQ